MKTLIIASMLLVSMFAQAAVPNLIAPLKSRTALANYLKSNPQEVAQILQRKHYNLAEPYGTEMKKLDLSNIDAAVKDQYIFLRALYFEDVLHHSMMTEINENTNLDMQSIQGMVGMTLELDMNGDPQLCVLLEDTKYTYSVAEKLAENAALIKILGGTHFRFETTGKMRAL